MISLKDKINEIEKVITSKMPKDTRTSFALKLALAVFK